MSLRFDKIISKVFSDITFANFIAKYDYSLENFKQELELEKKDINPEFIAGLIDHTILKPETTKEEVLKTCDEAIQYSFASVCVNSSFVSTVKEKLNGTRVKVCTTVGFPLGTVLTEIKVAETNQAVKNGAEEIDMVLNVGKLKEKNFEYVYNDVKEVVTAARSYGAITKVILETCLLEKEEIAKASLICKAAGADFVKTSTGFNKGGAEAYDIRLMRNMVGNFIGVKASGGVRTFEDAVLMIENGASRIGASSSIKIIKAGSSTVEGY